MRPNLPDETSLACNGGAQMAGQRQEIRQLAYYQVRQQGLDKSLAAIRKFVDYVRANEPGTLRYEVWQEKKDSTRFVHIFVFKDAEADRTHSESKAVEEFSGALYPQCLAPVEFVDYKLVATNVSNRPNNRPGQ